MRLAKGMLPWVLGWCMGCVTAVWGQGPVGEVFRIDTEGRVAGAEITDSEEGFVVVWDNLINPFSVYLSNVQGRRVSSLGTPLDDVFVVNAMTTQYHANPAISGSQQGTFLVTWNDYTTIRARRLDETGSKLGDETELATLDLNPSGSSTATLNDGDFVVVWPAAQLSDGDTTWVIEGRKVESAGAVGETFQVNVVTTGFRTAPRVAATPDGGFLVTWLERFGPPVGGRLGLRSRRFSAAAEALTDPAQIQTEEDGALDPSLAINEAGDGLVVWTQNGAAPDFTEIYGRRLDPMGQPLGGAFRINEEVPGAQNEPAVAAAGSGFLVVWHDGVDGDSIHGRWLPDPALPWGETFQLNTAQASSYRFPSVTAHGHGTALATWRGPEASGTLQGRLIDLGCVDGPTTLCLYDGRYRVTVQWRDYMGRSGLGDVAGRSDTSGVFSFFGPDNLEVLVKMVDGCAHNGSKWVFISAASDVALTVFIRDTVSGTSETYSNPLGRAAPQISDMTAFSAACGDG